MDEILDEKGNVLEGPQPGDKKYYEIVEYKGEQCRHYTYTGAYISLESGKICGNDTGRVDWDGTAMVTLGHNSRREAILDGLAKAAVEHGVGVVPTAMLSEIVRKRAKVAVENEGRAGNDAAKFVWGLVGYLESESGAKGPAVRIDLDEETAKTLMKALVDL